MSQATYTIGANQSGIAYRTADNSGKQAIVSNHAGTTLPSYALASMHWYDTSGSDPVLKHYDGTDSFSIGTAKTTINKWVSEGAERNIIYVAQNSHGFVAGDILRYNGTAYVKAQANSSANAQISGVVESSIDTNNFALVTSGKITGLSGLTAGTTYYLSSGTAGLLTSTAPASNIVPVLMAYSTTAGYALPFSILYTPSAGSITTDLLSSDTQNLFSGMKNKIINGDGLINQRGSSASASNGAYCADRFKYLKTGAMVHDLSTVSDAPTVGQAGRLITTSMLIDCTTVDTSLAGTDVCLILQSIEGYNWKHIAQKSFTISFWHKHTKTGIYSVSFQSGIGDRSYVAEYTQAVTDTWEFATITVSASPSGGTWDYTNGTGVNVIFALCSGSSFTTSSLNQWNSADQRASSNQVNACDSTSNNFRITGVQIEAGSQYTPFECRDYDRELRLCGRYFQSLTNLIFAMNFGSTSIGNAQGSYPTPMRATPSGSYTGTIGDGRVFDFGNNSVLTAMTVAPYDYGTMQMAVTFTTTGGFAAGRGGQFALNWNGSTLKILLSAEL